MPTFLDKHAISMCATWAHATGNNVPIEHMVHVVHYLCKPQRHMLQEFLIVLKT